MSNVVKTTLLLTSLTVLLLICGQALGGRSGMMFAFLFACVMNFGAYWASDKIVLKIYRAKPLSDNEAPVVHKIVHELAEKSGMPMPRIYLIPNATPNAFATGRNPENAVVAVTEGILQLLNEEELKGVLAHELAHVEHRDILISSIAATLAGAISMLAFMARWALIFGGGRRARDSNPISLILMAILVPIAASLIQLAVSRSREYDADKTGGALCGNPLYLASALKKLEAGTKKLPMQDAQPTTAHLFIVNPLKGGRLYKTVQHAPAA